MNILFLTLIDFVSIEDRNIYTDLLYEFIENGHNVCIISPSERKHKKSTYLIDTGYYKILKLCIGKFQKTNLIQKSISTLTLEAKYKQGIRKYYSEIKFDIVISSTPPITLPEESFKSAVEKLTGILLPSARRI